MKNNMPKDYKEEIERRLGYLKDFPVSPDPECSVSVYEEVVDVFTQILTTYGNARELEGVEKVKSKKKRILVVSDDGEVVPLDVILLRDLQSLEVKQELK